MSLQLFPEQQRVIDDIAEAFRAGYRRVMVSAACGFGKTELATAILLATAENGKRGAFIADRISLITQTSERFDKYGLPHGVMQASHWRYRPSEKVQVCSVQTLRRRNWPDLNLMVVDEAHVLHGEIRKKLDQKDCYAIGLSATAVTEGLGKYFDTVVNAPPTNRLIEAGRLVPLRIFSCTEPDMKGVKVVAGEWESKETEKRQLQVVGDVVAEYLDKGEGRKFIGFAVNIAHAMELQRQFLAAGINVATYTADDQPEDRAEIVQEFRKTNSTIRGILSVEALTRGFDVADVSCLVYARPLRKALAVHVQILGRVMRTAPEKLNALVLDHSGNCSRFWQATQDLFENGVTELDDGTKKEKPEAQDKPEKEPMKCPKCGNMHNPAPHCPSCGFEYLKRASVEHVPGTLKELLAVGNAKQITVSIWPMVCHYARQNDAPPDRQKSKALALYKRITGQWPKAEFANTEPVQPTPEVASKIRSLNIAWAKAKKSERTGVTA
jgi:superfamily II DNA or RNA helicase